MGKKLSATQAGKRAGVSTPTIVRAIKSGKLSGEPTPKGGWFIDPSEITRVYGDTPVTSNVKGNTLQRETLIETSVLETEVKMLREQMAWKDEILEELRQERDDWKDQAKTLLISNQNQPEGQGGKRDTRSLLARIINKQPA